MTLVHVFWHCTWYFWKSHSPIRCILSHDVTSGTLTRTGPAHILIPHAFLFMAAKNLSLLAVVKKAANLLGYENLRSSQEEAICRFLEGKDIFISLPTGSGKSLCYFVLPMIFNELRNCSSSIAIVVSPLTALMKEQVQKLLQRGVTAVYVGDLPSDSHSGVHNGDYHFVFMSPESLLTNMEWRQMIASKHYQDNAIALIIDEAHCVKQW